MCNYVTVLRSGPSSTIKVLFTSTPTNILSARNCYSNGSLPGCVSAPPNPLFTDLAQTKINCLLYYLEYKALTTSLIHTTQREEAMSRPGTSRTKSTNLASGGSPRSLEGKVALVTGASRGIGAATCENLAGKGASLVMNYTSDSSSEKTQKLAERLQQDYGIQCLPVQADMGSETGPAHIITMARNNFAHPKSGKFQIDIVINNAGIAGNMSIEETDIEAFTKQYNVNVRGPLLLMKAIMPYLPTDRSGRVVNLSSVSASLGFHKQSVYGGTKAALEAMTRTWARELSERCTVNSVNPGPVATDVGASMCTLLGRL